MSAVDPDFEELPSVAPVAQAVPGHNKPPADAPPETIGERLARTWAELVDRIAAIERRATEVPAVIDDEDTATRAADLVKIAKSEVRAADGARKDEKRPYQDAAGEVDGFFKTKQDRLEKTVAGLQQRLTVWLQEKAERERRRREAEALRLREEAAAKMREAEILEEQRVTAEAEATAATARANAARLGKEQALQLARNARTLRDGAVIDMRTAKAANAVDAYTAASARKATAEAELIAANARVDELRTQEQAELEAARTSKQEAKETGKAVEATVDKAGQHERLAARTSKSAQAAPADLSRQRGDLGSVTSLREDWLFEELSRRDIDLEALRPYLTLEGIEQGVRAWIVANKEGLKKQSVALRGVRIYPDTSAVVR